MLVSVFVFFDFYRLCHVKTALCAYQCHTRITSSKPQDLPKHNLHCSPAGSAPYSQWRHRWNNVKSVPAYRQLILVHSLHSISSFPFCGCNVTGSWNHHDNDILYNVPGRLFLCRFRNIRCGVSLSRRRDIRYNSKDHLLNRILRYMDHLAVS